jgi:hypothetical protein
MKVAPGDSIECLKAKIKAIREDPKDVDTRTLFDDLIKLGKALSEQKRY